LIASERRDAINSTSEAQLDMDSNSPVLHLLNDDTSRLIAENNENDIENNVVEDEIEDSRKEDDKHSKQLGYNKYMLKDVYSAGCHRLLKANLKKARRDAKARVERRQRLNKAVLDAVKNQSIRRDPSITSDLDVAMPSWSRFIMNQYPDFYRN